MKHFLIFSTCLLIIESSFSRSYNWYGDTDYDYSHGDAEYDYPQDQDQSLSYDYNPNENYFDNELVKVFGRNSIGNSIQKYEEPCQEVREEFHYSSRHPDFETSDFYPEKLYRIKCHRSHMNRPCRTCSNRGMCAQIVKDSEIYFKRNKSDKLWTKHRIEKFEIGCPCKMGRRL